MGKDDYMKWLKRAESNLTLAKVGHAKGVTYEDLCFEVQQSAEKALKALLVYFGDQFPKVHSFSEERISTGYKNCTANPYLG